ncbi:hypothetical protein [Paraburkholderia sp. BCC1886]|uniref:hypothetical protein n=1 Tax=Paraburkholderia sp. BCC1886 TaxID=2562670 RepID=UPI001181F410|nr:hypothetical protein [Paraburkholderia sp. BCC1886]
MPKVRRWYEALAAAGVDAQWIDLPSRGIAGNSHALMADTNSDAIGEIVRGWMREKNLVAPS